MKVIHIIGRFGGTGGAERSLQNLITAKRKKGYTQYVIGLQKAGVDNESIKQSGIKLYELETYKLSDAIISIFKLAKLIRKIDPDVIQSWMYYADLFSIISLYISGKRKKVRLFWGIRCSNLNLSEYTLKLRLVVRLCKYFSHLPDGIVANSFSGKDYHINNLGYKNKNWIVIYNGIDIDKYKHDPIARIKLRKKLNISEDKIVISHVARVDPMKDHQTLLNSARDFPDITFILIGKGTEKLESTENVLKLGERDDVNELLSASDLFILTSKYGEGFSNAISEAMASELSVITTDTGDTKHILENTGSIFPVGNVKSLSALISHYISYDKETLKKLGAISRDRIESNFSLDVMIKEFDQLYKNQLNSERIKITHIINSLYPGGAEVMLHNIFSKYDEKKYSVNVISLISDGPLKNDIEKKGVSVFESNIKPDRLNIFSFLKLIYYIRKNKPDIIQTWLYHSNIIGGVAGKLCGVKKIIWSIHASHLDTEFTKYTTRLIIKIGALVSNIIPNNIVYVSKVSFLLHKLLGYKCKINTVIPNGVDLEKFKPDTLARINIRNELKIPEDTFLIGIAGRYDPMKDHRNFLLAASKLSKVEPSAAYIMCGTSITKSNQELYDYIEELGLSDKVYLLGYREDMNKIYTALDVIAVTSRYGEAFPMVICESMACGTPCVVTNVGDSSYIVDKTGFTVEKENSDALVEAFLKISNKNKIEKQKLSSSCRERISSLFSLQSIVSAYEKNYY